jgi:hypothetical protein
MSKPKAKSAPKSKPAAKSVPKPKIDKRVEAAAPIAEPTVTTVADAPAAVEVPASNARRFTKAEGAATQNGITQPGEGTLCRKVWDALDKLRAEGKDATFEAVRELAGSEMADATIRTQRQRHREFNGIKREAKKPSRKAAPKAAAPAVLSEEVQQQAA